MSSFPIETSAEEAIKIVRPGHRIFIGQALGEPLVLAEALYESRDNLTNIEIIGGSWSGKCKYASKEVKGRFRVLSFMQKFNMLESVQDGIADYIPAKISNIHQLFEKTGPLPIDVALIQVSPPDDNGYCSLGIGVLYALDAALNARHVIAEVNDQMPRTLGNCSIHISKINYIVHSSRPLPEYPLAKIGEKEKKIGEYIANIMPDGATFETGIGAIPSAILASLSEKSDLGIHSGMVSDGIIPLVEKGIINNLQKPIDKGRIVTSMLAGSHHLYHYAHENPVFKFYPSSYTHDIEVIKKLPRFVSINSAIEVDLTGQVNAETVNGIQIAGVGGQADWVRGALSSHEGRSIIALTSTAQKGTKSKIVPYLGYASAVTTPRYDVDFVVTEYGIAFLKGKSLMQRAEAMSEIAHPDFRDQLLKTYKEVFKRRRISAA